jgi:hypothetical protein
VVDLHGQISSFQLIIIFLHLPRAPAHFDNYVNIAKHKKFVPKQFCCIWNLRMQFCRILTPVVHVAGWFYRTRPRKPNDFTIPGFLRHTLQFWGILQGKYTKSIPEKIPGAIVVNHAWDWLLVPILTLTETVLNFGFEAFFQPWHFGPFWAFILGLFPVLGFFPVSAWPSFAYFSALCNSFNTLVNIHILLQGTSTYKNTVSTNMYMCTNRTSHLYESSQNHFLHVLYFLAKIATKAGRHFHFRLWHGN